VSDNNQATEVAESEVIINEEVGTDDTESNAVAYSFDDLDSLTSNVTDSKELINESKEFLDKGSKETSKTEEKQSGYKAKDKGEEDSSAEEEGIAEVEEVKYRQGMFKDVAQEIAESTSFKHKVDGEDVDVSLKDLLNNYSGKVSYDKKFNEINVSRKELETELGNYKKEKESVDEYINDFAEKMKAGDAMGAISFLAEFAGMTPYEFRSQLLENIAPEVDRRRTLSRDQLSNEKLRAENEYLNKMRESEQGKISKQQANTELEQRIATLQETHSISDDDFETAYKELQDTELSNQLTPDLVARYCVQKNAYNKADYLIREVEPNLLENEKVINAVQKLIVDNNEFSDDEIKEIISSLYNKEVKKASKAVSKKIQSSSEKQAEKGTSEEYENYIDFEDFD